MPKPKSSARITLDNIALTLNGHARQNTWLGRLAFAGCLAEDSEEDRRQKAVLTVTSLVKCSVCPLWYGAYFLVGAPWAALGPFVYQMATIANVLHFFYKKDFAGFRTRQMIAILVAPWWMHLALGGFAQSAEVLLWSILAPLTALLFHGPRQSIMWLAAFLNIIAISGFVDSSLPVPQTAISPTIDRLFGCMNLAMPSLIAYMAVRYFAHLIELEKKVQVRLNAEIVELNRRLKAENLRLGAELDVARRLQMMVLPKQEELLAVPNLDIAGFMRSADQVGGDYYDVLHFGTRTKVGIGDVTGHGLEAGLVMLMVQSVARALHEEGEYDPVRFLKVLNQAIYKNVQRTHTDKTLSVAFLDFIGDRVVLSGQHEEILLIRENDTVERIDTAELGFPVGLEPDISSYVAVREIRFGRGDYLVLYTDGVTEAANDRGDLYGIERLCQSIVARRDQSAEQISSAAISDLLQFIGTSRIHDDISLVVIKHP